MNVRVYWLCAGNNGRLINGTMKNLSEILGSYTVQAPESVVRAKVASVILDCSGVEVPIQSIRLYRGTAYLSLRPVERSVVFMKKKDILKKLSTIPETKNITSIH